MNRQAQLSKQEILDYASRYVAPQDAADFAHNNDLFCMLGRTIVSDTVMADDKGWEFRGYGLCIGYTVDEIEIPVGKWLWMHFVSLATFPPSMQTLKLQPPHVVKALYQNPERTEEFRIVKINMQDSSASATVPLTVEKKESPQSPASPGPGRKVLLFRKKPRAAKTPAKKRSGTGVIKDPPTA